MTSASPCPLPPGRSGRSPLDIAIDAARRGGAILRERFSSELQISFKGRANVVTDVDIASERVILDLLREEYPDFGLLSEESPPEEGASAYRWVIDPLDGTRNYASGIPHFCVVVGLAHGDTMLAGVTYDPMREQLFTAIAGFGARLNGEPLRVSNKEMLEDCLLGFDLGYIDSKAILALDMIRGLWPGMQSIRLMGSSALGLAYAAAGWIDLYFHHSLYPWDIASGLLLLQEAGGVVVDRQGRPAGLMNPSVIGSSPRLVEAFLQATDGTPWRNQT